VKTAA